MVGLGEPPFDGRDGLPQLRKPDDLPLSDLRSRRLSAGRVSLDNLCVPLQGGKMSQIQSTQVSFLNQCDFWNIFS